jgi:predicted dehydrogenase
MFLYLTGEEAEVTGAQLSRRAHERPVEDYASVMLRSESGIIGTVEVGNCFPRDGTDGEWKIAGRDAILTMKDGITKLATAEGDETFPGATVTSPYFTALAMRSTTGDEARRHRLACTTARGPCS